MYFRRDGVWAVRSVDWLELLHAIPHSLGGHQVVEVEHAVNSICPPECSLKPSQSLRVAIGFTQNFRRMLTSLMGQKSPIGGSFPATW
jgi:hypothetical protein